MDRLQLIEPRLGTRQAQLGRLAHQTELGVDVFQLLVVAQRVPAILIELVHCQMKRRV
jgi:hypothetical protein